MDWKQLIDGSEQAQLLLSQIRQIMKRSGKKFCSTKKIEKVRGALSSYDRYLLSGLNKTGIIDKERSGNRVVYKPGPHYADAFAHILAGGAKK